MVFDLGKVVNKQDGKTDNDKIVVQWNIFVANPTGVCVCACSIFMCVVCGAMCMVREVWYK